MKTSRQRYIDAAKGQPSVRTEHRRYRSRETVLRSIVPGISITTSDHNRTDTVKRTKLCRSELSVNDVMHRHNALRPFPLFCGVPILRHCDAFVTNFSTAEFRAL
ncbi:hypothetical protein EVAR_83325_1 [Eumeta japonica]|uniref:Uncharacterized protein n=1 Tax=Eumeta variegata TaxID=151549 RepID=A0A4C1VY97_EUMVA|nr:hypothetical protein EVAR_83325_1 [Eumeta japonica]